MTTVDRQMDWVVLHWTATNQTQEAIKASAPHYHYIIDRDGKVVECNDPYENWCPKSEELAKYNPNYIRHAGLFNTRAIGISLLGMGGAIEKKTIGHSPINIDQVNALVEFCAGPLYQEYKVSAYHHVPHSYVWHQLRRGRIKWDINWTPETGYMSSAEAIKWWSTEIHAAMIAQSNNVPTAEITADAEGIASKLSAEQRNALYTARNLFDAGDFNRVILNGILIANGEIP